MCQVSQYKVYGFKLWKSFPCGTSLSWLLNKKYYQQLGWIHGGGRMWSLKGNLEKKKPNLHVWKPGRRKNNIIAELFSSPSGLEEPWPESSRCPAELPGKQVCGKTSEVRVWVNYLFSILVAVDEIREFVWREILHHIVWQQEKKWTQGTRMQS